MSRHPGRRLPCPVAPALLARALSPRRRPLARADATIVSRDVPLRGERDARRSAPRFDASTSSACTGEGRAAVAVRRAPRRPLERVAARGAGGRGPARRGHGASAPARGWRLGNPYWDGPSDRIEYRPRGRVRRLRAYYVWSPAEARAARTLPKAGAPAIVPRSAGRDETDPPRAPPSRRARSVRGRPPHRRRERYTRRSRRRSCAAIQLYHVQGNGWNDIGYNFLVDTLRPGLRGPLRRDRAQRRRRARGGVQHRLGRRRRARRVRSLAVTAKARGARALVRLLAWRLDVAHVDPLSTLTRISGGNARFRAGVPVFLRAISGHRDTGFTDCPGDGALRPAQLDRRRGRETGLPKLYAPSVTGAVPAARALPARLSRAAARGRSTSTTRPGTPSPRAGRRQRRLDVGRDGAAARQLRTRSLGGERAAGGAGRSAAATSRSRSRGLAADPETGLAERRRDRRQHDDHVHAEHAGERRRRASSTCLGAEVGNAPEELEAGRRAALPFDAAAGRRASSRIELPRTRPVAESRPASTQLAVTRTLGGVAVTRLAFSPNADGRADQLAFRFSLAAPAEVRVRILKNGAVGRDAVHGAARARPADGRLGRRQAVGRSSTGCTRRSWRRPTRSRPRPVALPFAADTAQPRLRIVTPRRSGSGSASRRG